MEMPMLEALRLLKARRNIQEALEKRFGTVMDLETGRTVHKKFDQLSLIGNCGDVSRITSQKIGGTIRKYEARGSQPRLYYQGQEIADGNTIAIHQYVIDPKGYVWDAITNNWGLMKEEEYLQNIQRK